MYLGIDVGGTHTDAVLCANGKIFATAKVKTQHTALALSIQNALASLMQNFENHQEKISDIQRITIGTTLGLNALVLGKNSPVGLFVTAGPGMNPLRFVEQSNMAEHCYVVSGGLDHRGQEVTPLNLDMVQEQAKKWLSNGIKNFAIAGKFSTRNPAHENAIAAELLKITSIQASNITLSHNISGELNFPRRMASAYFNASIQEIQREFLDAIQESLTKCNLHAPVYMLQADGGAISWQKAYDFPLYSVLSGPCASIMGAKSAMALHQSQLLPDEEKNPDAIMLDMGGTTTDIALYAGGIPLLDREGMRLNFKGKNHKTSLRSLMTRSLALGGDNSLLHMGQNSEALALGGTEATLLDVFNAGAHLQGLPCVGNIQASLAGISELAKKAHVNIESYTLEYIEKTCQRILQGIEELLQQLQGEPAYTLEKLLENYTFNPKAVYFVGAPAQLCAHFLAPYLKKHLGVETHVPHYSPIANALGAALTLPTAQVEFFADSLQGIWHIPTLELQGRWEKNFTLPQAISLATKALQETAPLTEGMQAIDVIAAESFAILDNSGRSGKDMRVVCQWRPGLVDF